MFPTCGRNRCATDEQSARPGADNVSNTSSPLIVLMLVVFPSWWMVKVETRLILEPQCVWWYSMILNKLLSWFVQKDSAQHLLVVTDVCWALLFVVLSFRICGAAVSDFARLTNLIVVEYWKDIRGGFSMSTCAEFTLQDFSFTRRQVLLNLRQMHRNQRQINARPHERQNAVWTRPVKYLAC